MASNQPPSTLDAAPRASADVIAATMLALGRLLDEATGKSGRRMSEEMLARIKHTEKQLADVLTASRSKCLQAILDFSNNGKPLDELALRIVCWVAHAQISGSGRTDVRAVVQAVAFENDLQPVRARQLIFRLCVRRALTVEDNYYGREQVGLGRLLLDFLRGNGQEPLVISRGAIHKAQVDLEAAARKRRARAYPQSGVPTAREIYDRLSKHVAGQHDLKVALSVAGRQTLLRREARLRGDKEPLPPKANCLLIGPSGSGKTYSSLLLSRILGLPFSSIDVSQVSASGYVGDDLSGVLYLLAQSAAEMGVDPEDGGVVYLDEIDKIARTAYESATTLGVQFEALRLLDGGEVSYPTTGLFKWGGSSATMDTSGLLVVASGAYSWLQEEWSGSKASIGFDRGPGAGGRSSDDRELLATRGGMLVELMNRFTAVVRLQSLTLDDIAAILQGEFGPVCEYRAMLQAEGRSLSVEDGAASAIARWSVERGLLGRGPKVALERILRESLFSGQPTNLVVTREMAEAALSRTE